MHDPLSFEARLENAFDRYGAAAPTSVDSRVLAAALAREGQRRLSWPARPWMRVGYLRFSIVLGLLAFASAAALLVAGSIQPPGPLPLNGGGRILVSYPVGPGALLTIDGASVSSRLVDVSGCPRAIANADAVATYTRHIGIRFGSFDGTWSSPISTNYAGGERWSPGNRTLALMNWTDRSLTFVSVEGRDVAHPAMRRIHLDLAGPPSPGTDDVQFDGTFSPDGRRFLLRTEVLSGDPTAGRRYAIIDVADGDPRPLATLPAGSPADYADPAWSPDGARIAALATHGGVRQLAVLSATSGELRWLDLRGDVAPDAEMMIEAWSPDGAHIAVWAGGHLALVDATTGAWTATPVTRPLFSMSVAMTQDGRHLAMVSGPTLTRLDVTTGAVEQRELASAVTSWSPDRSALAVLDATTGSGSARVLVFDPWSDSAPSVAATLPGPQAQADASGTDGPCIQWLPEVPR